MYLWLKMTNSTVSDVLCLGPPEYQEKKLNDVTSFDYECTTTGMRNLGQRRCVFGMSIYFTLSTGVGMHEHRCYYFRGLCILKE